MPSPSLGGWRRERRESDYRSRSARMARWSPAARGQNMVEFALILPIFLSILLVGLQLSFIGVQYYSIIHVTRDTARWVAINPDTIDSAIATRATNINLPGAGSTGIASVAVSP